MSIQLFTATSLLRHVSSVLRLSGQLAFHDILLVGAIYTTRTRFFHHGYPSKVTVKVSRLLGESASGRIQKQSKTHDISAAFASAAEVNSVSPRIKNRFHQKQNLLPPVLLRTTKTGKPTGFFYIKFKI
jgi:hypothetical protein